MKAHFLLMQLEGVIGKKLYFQRLPKGHTNFNISLHNKSKSAFLCCYNTGPP